MKVRIYNDRFSFEETLHFFEEDEFDFQYKQYWENAQPISCEIKSIPKNHPVYGWFESYVQSQYALNIEFTHIEFTKVIKEGDVSGDATCFENKVDGVIPVRVSITPPSAYL